MTKMSVAEAETYVREVLGPDRSCQSDLMARCYCIDPEIGVKQLQEWLKVTGNLALAVRAVNDVLKCAPEDFQSIVSELLEHLLDKVELPDDVDNTSNLYFALSAVVIGMLRRFNETYRQHGWRTNSEMVVFIESQLLRLVFACPAWMEKSDVSVQTTEQIKNAVAMELKSYFLVTDSRGRGRMADSLRQNIVIGLRSAGFSNWSVRSMGVIATSILDNLAYSFYRQTSLLASLTMQVPLTVFVYTCAGGRAYEVWHVTQELAIDQLKSAFPGHTFKFARAIHPDMGLIHVP